jgi:signal transduction histidine kinase
VPSYEDVRRSLTEAIEQQTAASEILRVISSSPSDIQPVFNAIAQSARRLCGGDFSVLLRYDGELLHRDTKIEAGRMELELTNFDLPTAIDNALMLIRERAGRRSITLQRYVDERLGEARADERKIRQVVLNLLSNAIKFTPEGGQIEVHAVPRDGSIEVSVTDTGVGIAPEDREAVFEEFRQVGTAEKKAEGTGLGLTLCRKFIELHGGRIWVKSQVGVGSTFTFTIPVRRGE